MREKEAAAYLHVNPRTLYRYRQKGRLAFRVVPSQTRPHIEYAQADVEALGRELERQRSRSVKPAAQERTDNGSAPRRVSFGLPSRDYEELAAEASRYGMKVGEYARQLVREGLESRFQAEASELHDEMNRQNSKIDQVRNDFAAGFEAILEFTGLSTEEAKEWVTNNLR